MAHPANDEDERKLAELSKKMLSAPPKPRDETHFGKPRQKNERQAAAPKRRSKETEK